MWFSTFWNSYTTVGPYLFKSPSRVGAYSREGLFGSGDLIDHLRYIILKIENKEKKIAY